MKKVGFFEENEGQKSWMRLSATFILLLVALLIVKPLFANQPIDYTLVVTLLTFANLNIINISKFLLITGGIALIY